MSSAKHEKKMAFGIWNIEPVDLHDPSIMSAMEQARRSLKNENLGKILQIRTTIQQFFCNRLVEDGYVHPPVYMLAGCTDPLNHWTYPALIDYYGEEVSVTQSLILQKLLMVMLSRAEKVFWASPNIRMEMRIGRKDYKYATEFMQVDFEKKGATYAEMLGYVSDIVRDLYAHLNKRHGDILEEIRGTLLPELTEPLEVYDAAEVKREHKLPSDDAVEKWGSEQSGGRPFMVVNLKREAYDCFDEEQGRFLNYDVVLPPCRDNPYPIECLSGAERTRSISDLKARMTELDYPLEYFAPFFDVFEALDEGDGKIACAGAGFGIERLTAALLGLKDVHEVYPFPRLAEGKIAL